MCTISLRKRGQRVCITGPERVYTIEASDPKKGEPQGDATSHATQPAIVEFLTCHVTVIACRGLLQDSAKL